MPQSLFSLMTMLVFISAAVVLSQTAALPAPHSDSILAQLQRELGKRENAILGNILYTDPDCNRDAMELILSKGYPGEKHEVVTTDGYILGLQRIPYGLGQQPPGPGQKPRPVILLQHGLLGSSTNWLTNLANQSFAYVLADAGFDVWLGNVRGNTYSLNHISLTVKDAAFWQFSWDEFAKYDLPAMVNYIKIITRQPQIYYAGHSQGTMMGFAQFSQDVAFGKSIKAFFALAPVANVGNIQSGVRVLAPFTNNIALLLKILGENQFLPQDDLLHSILNLTCSVEKDPTAWLCDNLMFAILGHKTDLWNASRIPVFVAHNPAGTSAQNVAHFGQGVASKKFQMYDFGAKGNMAKYGQATPPEYDPSKIEVPIVTFAGLLDTSADPTDVAWLLPQLKSLVAAYTLPNYAHLDFIFATTAVNDVYSVVIDHIRKLEGM